MAVKGVAVVLHSAIVCDPGNGRVIFALVTTLPNHEVLYEAFLNVCDCSMGMPAFNGLKALRRFSRWHGYDSLRSLVIPRQECRFL